MLTVRGATLSTWQKLPGGLYDDIILAMGDKRQAIIIGAW